MSKNKNLIKAKKIKNDEFYTQYEDIAKELNHYKDQFKGKKVLLPCDESWSQFVKFFKTKAKKWGVIKVDNMYYNAITKQGAPFQEQNWDEYDIIVTNPPFSLFREFVDKLINENKKFLIIGALNAQTYKEISKLVSENKIWLGYDHKRDKKFTTTISGKTLSAPPIWYTNLEVSYRNDELVLSEEYYGNENKYPFYDNYPRAIHVDRTKDIPHDFFGVMMVPITFLTKHNPNQFKILGISRFNDLNNWTAKDSILNGKQTFMRYVIQRIK